MSRMALPRAALSAVSSPCALVLALLLALYGCEMDLAGGSSSTETGEPVSLSGRVTGVHNQPVAGVVVSLANTGLSDTTDGLGLYHLQGRVDESPHSGTLLLDTLRFELGRQVLALVGITRWVNTLSDVQVIQRGFSGSLLPGSVQIAKIEGVVTGDGIAPGDSVAATFFHNTLAGDYSGYMYFPPGFEIRNYEIHVNVYDSDGRLTGRSLNVPFNSHAGNVIIPEFDPGNLQGSGNP